MKHLYTARPFIEIQYSIKRGLKLLVFIRERDVFYPKKIKLWWGIIYIFYLFHVECEKEKARGGINNSVHNESFSSLVYLHQHHSTLNVGELSLYIWALYVTTCILREEFLEHKKLLGSLPGHELSCCESWRISLAEQSLCWRPFLWTN